MFRIVPSSASGAPALHLTLPSRAAGLDHDDYTTSLVVNDLIGSRREAIGGATGVRLKLRGTGPKQRVHITLMEKDGTSWSAAVTLDSLWSERTIPLADFRIARGVKLPQGFPGQWSYWIDPASGRGKPGDAIRVADVERLQLSLRPEEGVTIEPGQYGVDVESVTLLFR